MIAAATNVTGHTITAPELFLALILFLIAAFIWLGTFKPRAMTTRRFPPPWSVEEQAACFVVRDSNGDVFATVYYEQDPARRAAAKLPTKDEAHRIAAQFTKLPELLDAGGLVPPESPPTVTPRSFPLPWSVEDIGDAFVVSAITRRSRTAIFGQVVD